MAWAGKDRERQGGGREGMKEAGAGLTHLHRSHTATSPALRPCVLTCVGRADNT